LLISLRANEPGLPIRNSEILQNDSDSSVESSHSVKKRASSRVTIFLNVTRVESESPKIVTRVDSLTRVTLSLMFCRRWKCLDIRRRGMAL